MFTWGSAAPTSSDLEYPLTTPEREVSTDSETCCFCNGPPMPLPKAQTLQQFGCVAAFVALGAGQAIAAKRSLDDQGDLPYDSGAAVFWAEVLKLSISLLWTAAMDRDKVTCPIPCTWLQQSMELVIVAFLFAITNELNFLVVEYLGPALFMILGNLKIVFTCFFMRLMLGKLFSAPQWAGVVLLTASAAVVKLPALQEEQTDDAKKDLQTGMVTLIASTICSGLASVTNEKILKGAPSDGQVAMPFMAKNSALYAWGVILNFGSWAAYGQFGLCEGFNTAAVFSVLCLAGLGLACSIILCYLDNVARCFASVVQVLVTVAASRLMLPLTEKDPFGWFYVLSLVLLAAALVVYQAYQSPRFPGYAAAAMLGALLVGLACMEFDRAREGAV